MPYTSDNLRDVDVGTFRPSDYHVLESVEVVQTLQGCSTSLTSSIVQNFVHLTRGNVIERYLSFEPKQNLYGDAHIKRGDLAS